jgi:hypothetical protein
MGNIDLGLKKPNSWHKKTGQSINYAYSNPIEIAISISVSRPIVPPATPFTPILRPALDFVIVLAIPFVRILEEFVIIALGFQEIIVGAGIPLPFHLSLMLPPVLLESLIVHDSTSFYTNSVKGRRRITPPPCEDTTIRAATAIWSC